MNWRRSGLLAVAGALIARWYFGRLVASADAADRRGGETTPFFDRLLHGLRHRRRKNKIADSTGAAMTGGELLTRSMVLRRLLRRTESNVDGLLVSMDQTRSSRNDQVRT